jgi:16S rRNA (uracil1498-N3)-methyltransferase
MEVKMHYFFVHNESLTPGSEVALLPEDHNHAYRVLRLKTGEAVTLADGKGLSALGKVSVSSQAEVKVRLERELPPVKPAIEITLLQALTKGDKLDLIFRQAVELGVSRLTAVETDRTIPQLDSKKAEKRLQRWKAIVRAASAQCRRPYLPLVEPQVNLLDYLDQAGDIPIIVPWEAENSLPLAKYLRQPSPSGRAVFVLIGPEGGFTTGEIDALEQRGAVTVSLGPRILRSETAAVTTIALVQSAWGDLALQGEPS